MLPYKYRRSYYNTSFDVSSDCPDAVHDFVVELEKFATACNEYDNTEDQDLWADMADAMIQMADLAREASRGLIDLYETTHDDY